MPCSTRRSAGSGPQWYEANAPLVERYGVEAREAEWDARWWSPIINAEHLAMREHAGIFDLSAFAIFDVAGPGALDALQHAVLRPDGRAGRPGRLHAGAQPGRRLQVRPHDHAARRRRLPDRHGRRARHGRPEAVRRRPARRRLGEPRRRHDGVDDDRPLGAAGARHPRERHLRRRLARGLPVRPLPRRSRSARSSCSRRASRTSATWAGSCTCRSSRARVSGTSSGKPARRTALTACGIGVYGTTGRLEKAYRAYGAELETEYNVVEAGMQRPTVKEQDFVGKEAHLRHREEEPAAVLCTLTVDDHALGVAASSATRSAASRSRSRDGTPLTDAKGRRSYVTSAGAGPSLGKYILHGVSAARARGRGLGRAGGRVHERAVPRHRRRSPEPRALRSRECEDPVVKMLVCVKRVPMTGGRIVLTDDEQAIETKHLGFAISPHEECGVEEAVRIVEASRRRVGRADARPRRRGGAAARRDGDRHRPRASTS